MEILLAIIGFIYLLWVLIGAKEKQPDSSTASTTYQYSNVSSAIFKRKNLLNKSEQRLFLDMQTYLKQRGLDFLISPQVSYGEFLYTQNDDHFRAINTKRADFIIWTFPSHVKAVIEYDGRGHWGKSQESFDRAQNSDKIKNHACSSAGIPIFRVAADYDAHTLYAAFDRAFGIEINPETPPEVGEQQS